jgi:CBS domain-containing protein
VVTIKADEPLATAARLMWEEDCGVLPVLDGEERVIAMITDRDVCMAAYTQGLPLEAIPVSSAMSSQLFAVRPNDPVALAEKQMGERQIRRLPVIDADGRALGILSMNDLARETGRLTSGRALDASTTLVRTLNDVGAPHHSRGQAL